MTRVLLLALLPTLAHAERPITYQEALRAALQSNPTIASSDFGRLQAEASVMTARGIFDPGFTFDTSVTQSRDLTRNPLLETPLTGPKFELSSSASLGGELATGTSYNLAARFSRKTSTFDLGQEVPGLGSKIEQSFFDRVLSASVTQAILEGHRTAYNLQNVTQAEQSLSIAELTLEKTRQDVLAQTAAAYWNWVYRVQLVAISREEVRVAELNAKYGDLKVKAGDLAPVEGTRLRAAMVQARSTALEATNAALDAADTLALLMGETPGQDLLPATAVTDPSAVGVDVGRAIEVANAQNLDLQIARARVTSAEITQDNAKHSLLPSLGITASAGLFGSGETLGDAMAFTGDTSFPWVTVSGALSLPVRNRAARGAYDNALQGLNAQKVSLQEAERSVAAQVAAAVRTVNSAQQRIELARANVGLATQTRDAERALVAAGRSIQRDLIEAEKDLTAAQAELAKAQTDYQVAVVSLQQLQGQVSL